jgi:hypothetical protein
MDVTWLDEKRHFRIVEQAQIKRAGSSAPGSEFVASFLETDSQAEFHRAWSVALTRQRTKAVGRARVQLIARNRIVEDGMVE